jgi:catechol 2,3-dioxygenase-like lactoylglutathione lyase family enzyme
MHHASIRTADIHRAMAFYEILGFVVVERFTAGYTLACWMEGLGGRIELIQVPEPQAAADPFGDEHYVGYYHLSFDLTAALTAASTDLPSWLAALRARFTAVPLRVLLEPQQQMIGSRIYEVAFIADADGMPLELIRQLGVIRGE